MGNNNSNGWKPITGGILNIVSGVLGIIGSLLRFAISPLVQREFATHPAFEQNPEVLSIFIIAFLVSGIVSLIPCGLSIIGGVFATQRKHWEWALIGSISSVFVNVFGFIAIIFIATSKNEFIRNGDAGS